MPRKAKPGDRIGKYEILKEMHVGGMAISYSARSSHGEKVFLKQYKSPSSRLAWYSAYVEYQNEVERRIASGTAKSFCCKAVEFFEADTGGKTYFQVFEFVEGEHDLATFLGAARINSSELPWDNRLTLAMVIMSGVNALHEAKVVHCDLKPRNIKLIRDDSIEAKYRLKLVGTDFSVLTDRRAPWHGEAGYVGSPNYFSPEHLRGEVPRLASDVFTCGLILYELLAGKHRYHADDPDQYREAALKHRAPVPKLLGKLPAPATDEEAQAVLHRCLSPDPDARPTARDVHAALKGDI